jgi:hypothetical protein
MTHPEQSPSRRSFLKATLGAGAAASGLAACSATGAAKQRRAPRGATYMGDHAAAPLETVRMAFIGVGARGPGHLRNAMQLEGVEVVAICDNHAPAAERAAALVTEAGRPAPALYTGGDLDFLRMLESEQLDAVVISTPWRWHAPMGVAAMEAGAHAFIEVPIALTTEEMWDLVDASETTGRHCMMMENVNYGRDELLFLNMVRLGLLGELTHGEAAYIHDLRFQMKEVERGTGSWRTGHHATRNGNLYPTHGLGPVAQYMNLERGEDRFERLVSFSSPALGRAQYARDNFAPEHGRNQLAYQCGDMSTSLVKTRLGRTIVVQHDTTSPRPYSRLNLISGTRGTMAGFPTRIALDPEGHGAHGWTEGEALAEVRAQYDHPLYTRLAADAEGGGHGGMDFIMMWRMITCLREGQPLDQNVYEGCAWSAVAPLSEWSVAHDGAPAEFPDFTRGRWVDTAPLGIVS